jgi:hypothetical protein
LKKRTKKLLLFAPSRRFKWANQVLPLIGKSFLVLFFKKELLPSACLPFSLSRSQLPPEMGKGFGNNIRSPHGSSAMRGLAGARRGPAWQRAMRATW